MNGITFGDLITMVHSNEPVIDEEAVIRSFENLVQDTLHYGRRTLKQKMNYIIQSIQESRE